jgi:hypothetical protein
MGFTFGLRSGKLQSSSDRSDVNRDRADNTSANQNPTRNMNVSLFYSAFVLPCVYAAALHKGAEVLVMIVNARNISGKCK